MKKLYSIMVAVFIAAGVFAQSPEKMSYQAVVRDVGNVLVINQSVGMQISILQGSPTGTAAYVETQVPVTNINGLVSLEIGSGTPVTGTFATIDWSNGLYYIKTETDPTGGTTYTITGTSQLMSVPYALHANTADSIVGGVSITETDPIFGASIASGITAVDTANWNNHIIDTDTQLDSAGVAALGFITSYTEVDGDITNEIQNLSQVLAQNNSANSLIKDVTNPVDNQDAVTKFYLDSLMALLDARVTVLETVPTTAIVGDFRDGGVVFWVNPLDNTHGLVCTVSDLGDFNWGCFGTLIGTTTTSIGTGAQNSLDIVVGCVTPGIAADTTLNLSLNGYSSWFLPSQDELNEMYVNRVLVNATAIANGGSAFTTSGGYWSSTESSDLNAFGQIFGSGFQTAGAKNGAAHVRAIRAF